MPRPPAAQQAALDAATALISCGQAASTPGPGDDELQQRADHLQGVQRCLEQEAPRAAQELSYHTARQVELRTQLEQRCCEAERQHEGISASLAALAARLDCLTAGGGNGGGDVGAARPPLLAVELPDSYATSCNSLLESLAGYAEHHLAAGGSSPAGAGPCSSSGAADGGSIAGGGGGDLAAAHQLRAQRQELDQLQDFACKAARLRVEEEAEIAGLHAELEMLHSPSPSTAASLGYSAADLEAELASLRRRRGATLAQAAAAAEQAAGRAAGAAVVQETLQHKRALLEYRVAAKRQVSAMLVKHLARQLLVHRLLQHEQGVLQQVQATVAAARADAELALQAVQERLPQYADGTATAQQQRQQQAQPAGTTPAHEQDGHEAGDPLEAAEQLLAVRAQLQALSDDLHSTTLPAHAAVFAQLHGLLWGSSDKAPASGTSAAPTSTRSSTITSISATSSSATGGGKPGSAAGAAATADLPPPELTPPAVQAQLEAVAAAHERLKKQAHALLGEIVERQGAPAERRLAEDVLCDFWGQPAALVALAEKQQRRLDTYV